MSHIGLQSWRVTHIERMNTDIKFNQTALQNGTHSKVVGIHNVWADLLSAFPETVIRFDRHVRGPKWFKRNFFSGGLGALPQKFFQNYIVCGAF